MDSNQQALVDFYPQLKAKFCGCELYNYYKVFGDNTEYVFEWIRTHINTRCVQAERIISDDPWYTYLYAKDVIRGRWYDEEETILTDARAAYYYSRDIIGHQWDRAEEIVSTSPKWYALFCQIKPTFHLLPKPLRSSEWKAPYDTEYVPKDGYKATPYRRSRNYRPHHDMMHNHNTSFMIVNAIADILHKDPTKIDTCLHQAIASIHSWCAHLYAADVIRGQWIEAEEIIASNAYWSYEYAKGVIKGKYIEAEPTILTDAWSSYLYAKDIIGGRWVECEPIVLTSPRWSYEYAKNIIKGRWIDVEEVIASNAKYAYKYAKDIIGGRWIDAEEVILADSRYAGKYKDLLNICYQTSSEMITTPCPYYRRGI